MRWFTGLGLVGALAFAPGCTRANPGFGDDDGTADTDETSDTFGPSTSSTSGNSGASSQSGSTTGAPTSGTTDASTTDDTDGFYGSTGTTDGFRACEGGDGLLLPTVFSDAVGDTIAAETLIDAYTGDVDLFQDGTLTIHPCGACNCGNTPAMHFDLNQQPGLMTLESMPDCVTVWMYSTQGDGLFNGFLVTDVEGNIFYGGFDVLTVEPTISADVASIPIEIAEDTAIECGDFKDGCPEDELPGQYAVRFASSGPIYPGESTERRSLSGRDFIFHNRKSQYSIDGTCGWSGSWTMEFVP